ncbi:MAG: hypothetical protein IJ335_07980 [Lachnospiraceae bacterium]|nr:hypothetical protein [Lachnospiraceae bacterium]
MNDIEILNGKLKKEFDENKNYFTLERYVMSELLSPIEDYFNAINIIERNSNLIEGLNLYYIAAYLSVELRLESNVFLEKLNSMIDMVKDEDKAIIHYLNTYFISCSVENWRTSESYRCNLLESIEYSKNSKFVNNRFDFSKILEGKGAEEYLREAMENVEIVETKETLETKSINYWLSSQRFVDEFILGTHLSQEAYQYKFGKLLTS